MIFYRVWRSSHPSVLPRTHALWWCLRCVLVFCTANPRVFQVTLLETKCLMCMFYVCFVILTFYWFLLFSCLVCQLQTPRLHLIHPYLLSHARVCHGYAAFDFLTRRMHIELLSIQPRSQCLSVRWETLGTRLLSIHCSYSSVCLSVFAPYLLVSFNPFIFFLLSRKTQGNNSENHKVHLSPWLDFKHIYLLSYWSFSNWSNFLHKCVLSV